MDLVLEHYFAVATSTIEMFDSTDTNVEASIVYSPKSFIPRFLMTNLTVYVLGQSLNLIELAVQLENVEPMVQKVFGFEPPLTPPSKQDSVVNMPEGNGEINYPPSPTVQQKARRKTSKRNSHENPEKNKYHKAKQSCQSDDFVKINEVEQKFKQSEQSKELRCSLGVKVFGNELHFLDCDDVKKQIKQYSLNLAELTVKLLKGQEVQYNKRFSLATEELMLPTISGLPVKLALNASAATNLRVKGNVDFKQWSDFHLTGYIKPSAVVQVTARMGITGIFGERGLEWIATLRTSTSIDGGVQLKKGQEMKMFFNTPEESMDLFDISSKLYVMNAEGSQEIGSLRDHPKAKSCTDAEVSKLVGWQLCFDVSSSEVSTGLPFPLSGSSRAAVYLKKQDNGLQQYVFEAAYNYTRQVDTWIPNEANLHFLLGTPKSDIKRDVSIDISFNYLQKKFLARLVHPRKIIQLEGKLELFRNARIGYIQLLLDDKDLYFVKIMADMQTAKTEQHYLCQLELKLTKQGYPIILSGNFTKHLDKKIALSASLINVLRDTTSVSVVVERKMDEKLKQYSFEVDVFLPGVVGSRAIGLLQQKGNSWSNAVRVKYGLLDAAKHLQHECNTGQEIKLETGSTEVYRVEAKHELQCTQFPLYNHKAHIWHEETTSWIQSQLELNYGKHWDEINNKRKVMITQTFRNNSSPALASYFLEFTLQLPAQQLNYRTQLQHTHSRQGHMESSTNFKVEYNDRMPFVVGLHWKDTSKPHFKKWDGTVNMDTPWLYLYLAHKLNQPQRGAYQSSTELTSGKAISIKNLVINTYYKDSMSDKEGRIHIYTPSATYLKASTVNHLEGNVFRSYSEIASLWNQPLKTDLYLENTDRTKAFVLRIRGAKQEFNFTADYMNLAELRKTNLSVRCTWMDRKSVPIVIQLDGRVEELKRLKMFYQKQASLHFRHSFKLPVPQSFLLMETFTVNKKKKHYVLETKALLNGIDETVQTLTLGYQKKNPYICAGLAHPYKNKIIPKNMEMCVRIRRGQNMKYETEAVLKINKKDTLHFLGKYQNRSNDDDLWHIAHMDMSHGFQMKFPHAVILDGEIFSKHGALQGFDFGVMGRVTLNKRETSQFSAQMSGSGSHISLSSQLHHPYHLWVPQRVEARATGRRYGDSNFNGTLYFSSGGKRMISMEVDMTNEILKRTKAIGVTANIHHTLSAEQKAIHAGVKGNISDSRISVVSGIKINNKSLQMNFVGSREQKGGLILTLQGDFQHNMKSLGIIPQHLYMDGVLLFKYGIQEGNVSVELDHVVYGLQLRNSYGNNSVHRFMVAVRQNGSVEVPGLTELKGRLEVSEGTKEGRACLLVDHKKLCLEASSINNQDQSGFTGKVIHNIQEFQNAGITTNGSVLLLYDHISHNRTVTAAMKSGQSHIEALIRMERISGDSPKCQLSGRVQHNIHHLKKLGVPFLTTASCFYQVSVNVI
ncbi:uncharacterized protein LOC122816125 [Protopterus annectens]|uniref:uncharacterized protein LOC122816125 n=1 Tax=Protopterus annectens TaxID=7888 RepID=UPI001CFA8AB4|nr:uncharacterized protein LOC122816125 [Protopterus annectens]